MTDLYLEITGDLKIDSQGDLILAEGWDEIRQRIIRRIVTTPLLQESDGTIIEADYIYHTDYGLGLKYLVCATFTDAMINQLKQRVTQGIMEDAAVDSSYLPVITYRRPQLHRLDVVATFQLITGITQSLIFEFNNA